MGALFSACACLTCTACSGSSNKSPRTAKIFYFFFIAFATAVGFLLNIWGDDFASKAHKFYSFKAGCSERSLDDCFGTQSAYRVSFGSVMFFATLAVASMSKDFHLGLWGLKLVFWALFMVVSFFIPYDFFSGYSQFSRVASFLFLVAQIIILVDFAYHSQEKFADKIAAVDEKYADTYEVVGLCQNPWRLAYLAVVLVLQVGSFAALVGMYVFSTSACSANNGFLSITLLLNLLVTVMSASTYFGDRGVLTPSIISVYTTWLVWSAIGSNPADGCSPVSEGNHGWSIALAIFISAVSLVYTCYSATSTFPGLFASSEEHSGNSELTQTLVSDSGSAPQRTASGSNDDDDIAEEGRSPSTSGLATSSTSGTSEKYWAFHLIMIFASMYMAMLITNWQVDASSAKHAKDPTSNTTMWIKVACQWTCYALYIWSLVAPRVLTGRDFS